MTKHEILVLILREILACEGLDRFEIEDRLEMALKAQEDAEAQEEEVQKSLDEILRENT